MAAQKKDNEKEEAARLESVAQELTIILNRSRSPEKISRIQRDLESLSNRYLLLTGKDLEDAIKDQYVDQDDQNQYLSKNKYITKIKIERASPHSDNHEINLISSIVNEFEKKYWDVLSERHVKLDFTNSATRETFFTKMEEIKRNLKLVTDYIEDSYKSQSHDYVSKMRAMRIKQERLLLTEYNIFFQELRDFLIILVEDMENEGNLVLNPNNRLEFTKLDDVPLFIRGKTTKDAVQILLDFCIEAEDAIRLPDFG